MVRLIDADALLEELKLSSNMHAENSREFSLLHRDIVIVNEQPTVDAVPVPVGGIGELSDGYHTFNGLYYQRMMLFAVLVKTYKDRSWKSHRHSDGEPCFGGGWFIVGIDTPHGSYTYHYEDKYFDLFDCIELSKGKEWDGHTEDDVTRLLSLDAEPVMHGRWTADESTYTDGEAQCSVCKTTFYVDDLYCVGEKAQSELPNYCPHCGAKMDGEHETD